MPTTGEVLKKLKSKWVIGGFILIIVFVVLTQVRSKNIDTNEQIFTANKGDVTQLVLLSGTVEAVGKANLSFGISGKIENIFVTQGDKVGEGAVLAALDLDVLRADLLQAEGSVRSAEANIFVSEASVKKAEATLALVRAQNRGDDSSLESAIEKLENTKIEQEILVQNALQDLLSNDLQVYPDVTTSTLLPFVLTGSYNGAVDGEYNFRVSISSFSNIGYSINLNGIETGVVNFTGYDIPEALGETGLFVAFPSSGAGLNYNNSTWVIPVPNNRSATYQTKLNAYTKAGTTATLAISNAENDLDKLEAQEQNGEQSLTSAEEDQAAAALEEVRGNLEQAKGALFQAKANVVKVRAQLEDGIITAPFEGTIARIDFTLGENIGTANTGITLITDGDFELSMNVPEIDIAKISIDNDALITLDVYGNDVIWEGVITGIELIETEIDGVPVYESVISILNPDDRIRVGMNARAQIELAKVENVIAIPFSYIMQSNQTELVNILVGEGVVEERIVETGLRGSNNFVEITKGLIEGEVLIKVSIE